MPTLIDYTWRINNLSARTVDGMVDVIALATFTLTGVSGVYSASRTYSVELPKPDSSKFKPLGNLTEEQVIEWVKAALNAPGKIGVASVEKEVREAIDAQKERPPALIPLPWEKPT